MKDNAAPSEMPPVVGVDQPIIQGTAVMGIPTQGYVVSAPGYPQVYPQQLQQQQQISLWSTGLCHCMDDMDSTVETIFCGRCQLSRQYNQITTGVNQIEPWTFVGSLVTDVLLGMPITATMFSWYLRNRIRGRYQIAGDDFNDCLVAIFCNPCSACQVYREMSIRGDWPAGCCIHRPFQLRAPAQTQLQ